MIHIPSIASRFLRELTVACASWYQATRLALHPIGWIALVIATCIQLCVVPTRTHATDTKDAKATASLIRMSPAEENVEPPAEIVFQFDTPIVPLGRMERRPQEIAITFSPSLACQWRWHNPSALSCFLAEHARPLPATTYSVSVPMSFDTTSTVSLRQPFAATFTTSLPAVVSSWFMTWLSPTMPRMGIMTNQPVHQESLASHLIYEDGEKRTYPVVVAEATPDAEAPRSPEEVARDAGKFWAVQPKDALPRNSSVSLKITPGLSSTRGLQRGREERVITSSHTFSEFDFIGITCRDLTGAVVLIRSGEQTATQQKGATHCDPLDAIQLTFNAPISKAGITPGVTSQPDLRGERKDFDPWESTPLYSQRESDHSKDQHYYLNLPYGLKANTRYTLSMRASGVRDDFERPLPTHHSVTFTTDNRAARFVLDNRVSVLEQGIDAKLPVIVNNINSLRVSYQTLTSEGRKNALSTLLTPFKAPNIAYPFPIDIRALLGGRSGIVQGTITAPPPQRYDNTQRFFSQVTPYAVHAKLGHFNSLVWVTSMASGANVDNVQVSAVIDSLNALSAKPKVVASSLTDAQGIATLPGIATLDPKLEYIEQWEDIKPRLLIKIEKDGEMALVPLSWDYQVYDSEVYPYARQQYGHIHAWGTTAQGLYRVGDTVQFALWVRDQDNQRFVAAPRDGYSLEVRDPADKVIFQVPQLSLSEFGSFAGEFTTGAHAAVGWYTFTLKSSFTNQTWEPLRVLVSDFSPAPFKVSTEIQGSTFRAGARVTARTEARLHAGGPYADAAVRVTARLVGTSFSPTDPRTKGFTFSTTESDQTVTQREERLDTKGDLSSAFDLPSSDLAYGQLIVESAVRDDRGKFVAALSKAAYMGRSRFVGVKQDDWVLSAAKPAALSAVVVDESGTIIEGQPLQLTVEYEDVKVARVKSAGNAYTNRYEKSWITLQTCDRVSGVVAVTCPFTPEQPGRYRCSARVRDAQGREHTSSVERWATGRGDIVWQTENNNQLQIIPERTSYKVGETARFMIQNPFPTAHALFTVERYGIQRSWNQTITEPASIIEVPVTSEHLPGFFFSATFMSPRVDRQLEGQVDLGKPAFRMGYAQITVEDPNKQLAVNVSVDKATYKPRDTVSVQLSATLETQPVSPIEFAVAVIDESVFDLISAGRSHFDPYRGFYSVDGLDVKNYNLMKMLVGRQHFEKKGANAGGDGGGNLDMRSIQKYVSYWNPAIRADASGRASLTFEAPDNLTGWKVFALAFAREDRMGLGDGRFMVNKDTEVRQATPNLVRRGDSFSATFTVMNRTDRPRTLTVETSAEGESIDAAPRRLSITAEPFKRYPVVVSARAVRAGVAAIAVKAFDTTGGDALRVTLPILPRTTATTVASFGASDSARVDQSVHIPQEIDPDQGSIGTVLSASLLGDLNGAFTYMRDYPYDCWEQQLSKAVMAAYSLELKRFLPQSFSWPDARELVLETLGHAARYQAPNGGMTFYTASDEHVSPFLSAFTALAFSWLEELGYAIPGDARGNLTRYLDGVLRHDTFDASWSAGAKATVRVMALSALARATNTGESTNSAAFSATDIHRLSSKLSEMGIFGKSLYLQAAVAVGASAKSARDTAMQRLVAAGSESDSTFSLVEPAGQLSPWLLDSSMRSQCAGLDALIAANAAHAPKAKQLLTPRLQKLARAIMLDRKRSDRWENTQENLFCMRALTSYAKHYEQANSNLSVEVTVGAQKLATLSMKPGSSEPVEVSRPLSAADAGDSTQVTLAPTGSGRFYYSTRLTYAPREPQTGATHAGIEVTREYAVQRNGTWTALTSPMHIQQGELVAVNLFIRVSAPRYFVVVSDPVPGGLEPVQRDLATSSTVDTERAGFAGPTTSLWFTNPGWTSFAQSRWSFYHRELRHAAARFFSEYLEPGNYHLSYIAQAMAPGEFIAPPTHAETMYDPDIFGESTSDVLKIQ